jgi:hypothetical protein
VGLSPDGRRILSASNDKTLVLWESATGRLLKRIEGHAEGIACAGWSPDGRLLVSGGWDNTAILWDAESGRRLRTLEGHEAWIPAAAFSPDGAAVLLGSGDQSLSLWSTADGALRRKFVGHRGVVRGVAWSPDGQRAASAGEDGLVILWETSTGKALKTWSGHLGRATSVCFSPGGRRVLSASWDTTALLWFVHPEPPEAAGRWARDTGRLDAKAQSSAYEEAARGLSSPDFDTSGRSFERLLAAGERMIPSLLGVFPPEEKGPAAVAEDARALEDLVAQLDGDDVRSREKARAAIAGKGIPALDWVQKRLKSGGALSPETRLVLEGIRATWESASFDLGDPGRTRAVLLLLELEPAEGVRRAFEQYARGPARSYAAAKARRALQGE